MNVSREAFSPGEEAKKGGTANTCSPFAETCFSQRDFLFFGNELKKDDSYIGKEARS